MEEIFYFTLINGESGVGEFKRLYIVDSNGKVVYEMGFFPKEMNSKFMVKMMDAMQFMASPILTVEEWMEKSNLAHNQEFNIRTLTPSEYWERQGLWADVSFFYPSLPFLFLLSHACP